jgi:hypothetical protein
MFLMLSQRQTAIKQKAFSYRLANRHRLRNAGPVFALRDPLIFRWSLSGQLTSPLDVASTSSTL